MNVEQLMEILSRCDPADRVMLTEKEDGCLWDVECLSAEPKGGYVLLSAHIG